MIRKRRTLIQVEKLLGSFDLLAWAIESDCGKTKYLQSIKKKAKELRKELRNVPIPKHFRK